MMNCSWLNCTAPAFDVAVWRTPSGRCIVVGACRGHDRLPPCPSRWEELATGGDPEQVRELWHGRYR